MSQSNSEMVWHVGLHTGQTGAWGQVAAGNCVACQGSNWRQACVARV